MNFFTKILKSIGFKDCLLIILALILRPDGRDLEVFVSNSMLLIVTVPKLLSAVSSLKIGGKISKLTRAITVAKAAVMDELKEKDTKEE